jgi:hypothetical protein
LRSGKGHKYWSSYNSEVQDEIQLIAKEINEIIFQPSLKTPIKTLDLPMGGKNFSSQSQSLVLELVNKTNKIQKENKQQDDEDGDKTIRCLKACLKIVRRMNSTHPSSLGLHPAVYFYSKDGRHKPASFWAAIDLLQYLEENNQFAWFTDVRSSFEEFLWENDYVIQQIVRQYRSASAAYPHIKNLYVFTIDLLREGCAMDELLSKIKMNEKFSFINSSDDYYKDKVSSRDFSRNRKSQIFFESVFEGAARCSICNGLLHTNSITIDHIERKEDGGLGSVDNGQLSHPYCNSTYKN